MNRDRGRLYAYLFVVVMACLLVWRGETTRDADVKHAREARQAIEQRSARARREVCKFIDSEHDRERQRLIDGERQILGPFRDLFPNLTPKQVAAIHTQNRRRYNHVIDTRPSFCPPRSPIPTYPTVRELEG